MCRELPEYGKYAALALCLGREPIHVLGTARGMHSQLGHQ